MSKVIRALIIEDEVKAISALRQELSFNCKDVQVVGEAHSVADGIQLIKEMDVELVFLDIQLSDGLGFKILENTAPWDFKVIFTTAYSEYALKAFRFNALDYLLKPIDGEELAKSVRKIMEISQHRLEEKLDLFLHNSRSEEHAKKKIALFTSDVVKLVELKSIIRCNSEGNYTYFHFDDGTKLLISKTMKSFEEKLCAYGFARIHHSHIVNLDHLISYHNSDGGYVIMSDQSNLPVAQRRKTELLQILEKFNK